MATFARRPYKGQTAAASVRRDASFLRRRGNKKTKLGSQEDKKTEDVLFETKWELSYWHGSNWQIPLIVANDIGTARQFFGIHNALPPLSKIVPGTYNLFRSGTRPVWEDAAHEGGGKWTRSFSCAPSSPGDAMRQAEHAWLHMQLWALGENAGARSGEVLGVSATVRRGGARLSIWVSAPAASSVGTAPGKRVHTCAGSPAAAYTAAAAVSFPSPAATRRIEFMLHEGSIRRGRTYDEGAVADETLVF